MAADSSAVAAAGCARASLWPSRGSRRRVGEVEQRQARGQHGQRPAPEQDAPPGGRPGAGPLPVEPPGPLVVDRPRRDRQHRRRRGRREQRGQVEHGPLRDRPPDQAGGAGGEDVAGAVEGGVAAEARRQLVPPRQADGDGRHGRREHGAEHRHGDVRREDDRQRRRVRDREGARRQGGGAGEEEAALAAGGVDQGADRGLEGDADEPADGQHGAEGGGVPAGLGDEEHADVGPEPAAHVGQQEVERVEAGVVPHPARRRFVTGPTGRSAPAPLSATSASTGWGEVSLSTCGATSPPASRPPSSSLPLSSVSATPHLPGSAPFRGPASGTRGC